MSRSVVAAALLGAQVWSCASPAPAFDDSAARARCFKVAGTVKEIAPGTSTVVIAHEAIPGFMDAMTMPFQARHRQELTGLQPGDSVGFRLNVTDTESWIDEVRKVAAPATRPSQAPVAAPGAAPAPRHPLMSSGFTNELGQTVKLSDFRGRALAITFFFTRCPIPEFCPRLSRNFELAARRLSGDPNAPTNWHFLSVTFDPGYDTPQVLEAYGRRYHYDPAHWSFLTGPVETIRALAKESDVQFEPGAGFYNHNFRTLVIDASGSLQKVFPTSGDLAEALASEIIKAAGVTNRPS